MKMEREKVKEKEIESRCSQAKEDADMKSSATPPLPLLPERERVKFLFWKTSIHIGDLNSSMCNLLEGMVSLSEIRSESINQHQIGSFLPAKARYLTISHKRKSLPFLYTD